MVVKKKTYNNKELTKRDTIRVIPRPAYTDCMVEKADKEPRDITLQRSMLHPRISSYLTHAERERFRCRVKRYENRTKNKDPNIKGVIDGINAVVKQY